MFQKRKSFTMKVFPLSPTAAKFIVYFNVFLKCENHSRFMVCFCNVQTHVEFTCKL